VASIAATNLYGPLSFFTQEPLCGSPLIFNDVGTASLPFPGLNSHRIVPEVAVGSHVLFGHPWPPQISVPSAEAGDAPAKAHRPAMMNSRVMTLGILILSLPKRVPSFSPLDGFPTSAVWGIWATLFARQHRVYRLRSSPDPCPVGDRADSSLEDLAVGTLRDDRRAADG
jgi:hypothetical protein